jgi:hypothetical protein
VEGYSIYEVDGYEVLYSGLGWLNYLAVKDNKVYTLLLTKSCHEAYKKHDYHWLWNIQGEGNKDTSKMSQQVYLSLYPCNISTQLLMDFDLSLGDSINNQYVKIKLVNRFYSKIMEDTCFHFVHQYLHRTGNIIAGNVIGSKEKGVLALYNYTYNPQNKSECLTNFQGIELDPKDSAFFFCKEWEEKGGRTSPDVDLSLIRELEKR